MGIEDEHPFNRSKADEFLLATRTRYAQHEQARPLLRPATGKQPEGQPQKEQDTAPLRDEEQDLRAAAFLLATRSSREATERAVLQTAATLPLQDSVPERQEQGED